MSNYDKILDEMREHGYDLAKAVAAFVGRYEKTRNPHFLDIAAHLCDEAKKPMGATLQAFMAEESRKRLFESGSGGTAKSAIRELKIEPVFVLMANLIFRNVPLHLAASKAARWHNEKFFSESPYKASTLEKEYVKNFRSKTYADGYGDATTRENEFFSSWSKYPQTEEQEAIWKKLITDLPECSPDELGERR